MKNKVDIIKVVGIAGTVLGWAASLLAGWASNKTMAKTIEAEVQKQIQNK